MVDDGSTDGTADFLAAWRPTLPAPVLSQPAPRARRRRATPASRRRAGAWWPSWGTTPSPPRDGWRRTGQAHRRRGDARELAVIGYTGWHPRMRLTPFLRYINEHGLQFGYALIDDPENVPFNFFYTSNLSLARAAAAGGAVRRGLSLSGLGGHRARATGLSSGGACGWSTSRARGVEHDHPTDFARFAERQEKAGYSAVVFYRRHPELGPFLGLAPAGPPPLPPAPAAAPAGGPGPGFANSADTAPAPLARGPPLSLHPRFAARLA